MAKKKILVINYYRSKDENTRGVKEITDAIKEGGGLAKVIHHSVAQRRVKSGVDILENYDEFRASGSDITWTEKTHEDGTTYMDPGSNILAKYLVTHDKPGEFECGSGHAAYHALGQIQEETDESTFGSNGKGKGINYRVRNTGKFNKKTINGYSYNNKYAMDVEDIKAGVLEGKITNVETYEHEGGEQYVASATIGNKNIKQFHPGRTEKGVEDIKKFHGLQVGGTPGKVYKGK